jgi:hypothetical protein
MKCITGSVLAAVLAGASAQKAITAAPSAAPTAAPTAAPFFLPEDEQCVQTVKPPGVKPGSCMVVTCLPESVQNGDTFHVTVRWCLQYPRVYHLAFNLLNIETKEYYGGEGWDSFEPTQCGEHTFEHTLDAATAPDGGIAPDSLMWKFFTLPIWGNEKDGWIQDTFPNMQSECGVPVQPNYQKPLSGDCPVVETRTWNLPPTGKQDQITFSQKPECFTPGKPWTIQVDTHLESVSLADLRTNIQIGTGNDKYLGPEDIYVTEMDIFGVKPNPGNSHQRDTPGFWTYNKVTFPASLTEKVADGDNIYIASFMVKAGDQYNPNIADGWKFLEREFYLEVEYC